MVLISFIKPYYFYAASKLLFRYNNSMETGLTGQGAQLAICNGTYGGKDWSAAEKQKACQRYEELSGNKLEYSTKSSPSIIPGMAILCVLLVTILSIYIIKRNKSAKKKAHYSLSKNSK